jgi:hypothetical protein
MKTPYTYKSSKDYVSSLKFDYIETFSLQRGEEYERNLSLARSESERLKARDTLSEADRIRILELDALLGVTQYLINDKGQFHPSSKKLNTFHKDDLMVKRLVGILNTEIIEIPNYLCAPTYRDAIVFYNSAHEIVSVLNVCLECQYMETKMFSHINGDYETYDLLKRYFIDIGHEVEEPTNFVYDEIKKLRATHKK